MQWCTTTGQSPRRITPVQEDAVYVCTYERKIGKSMGNEMGDGDCAPIDLLDSGFVAVLYRVLYLW